MEELEVAKNRIKELEMELEKKNTSKQENELEDRLAQQQVRLEALEAKYKPSEKKEEEEEDGDQCPQCGHVLTELENGTYYCAGCREYFEPGD